MEKLFPENLFSMKKAWKFEVKLLLVNQFVSEEILIFHFNKFLCKNIAIENL